MLSLRGTNSKLKRGADPVTGWEITSKIDSEGTPDYAPAAPKKAIHAYSRKEYFYPDRNGEPLIKVVRIDDGNGKKDFPQYHWNGKRWLRGVPEEIRAQITIYRYQQVMMCDRIWQTCISWLRAYDALIPSGSSVFVLRRR